MLDKDKFPAMGASADHAVVDLAKQVGALTGPRVGAAGVPLFAGGMRLFWMSSRFESACNWSKIWCRRAFSFRAEDVLWQA